MHASYIILSKWDNVLQVLELMFDDEPKAVLKAILDGKRSVETLKRLTVVVLTAVAGASWKSVQFIWGAFKVVTLFTGILAVKSLTWNAVTLSNLVKLYQKSMDQGDLPRMVLLSRLAKTYISFYQSYHSEILQNWRNSILKSTKIFQQRPRVIMDKCKYVAEYSVKFLANLGNLVSMDFAPSVQYILPLLNDLISGFWGQVFALLLPLTFVALGRRKQEASL